ncbi:exporters of the RND superfamily [Parvibaculum lavamentivorans DS-1]|uniref:Exporters of the RND superfamily n=1 Tax=Parvibaculum lavamentivorans (strain DS-1 / DSM 13023 / NCIMB 13966) TaxID=402881 RepID=A7HS93_PARL1|nr:MMPL family transporter [Parvibaculum lavamentivorans]ABS62776.1 exporters of the RND superfamily [Parvibaculum lavamentivorans DS-1]
MDRLSSRIARAAMTYRWLSLLILTAITGFFAVQLPNVELRTIFSDLLPSNHPFVQTYKDHPNFGNPLTVTVMIKRKDGDIYNAETLQKVWDLTRDIDLTPAVDHDQILSVATEKARYAEATPNGIDSRPLMEDHAPRTPAEIAEFRNRLLKSPNVRTFMVSEDETATLVTATFIERLLDYGETFEYLDKLVNDARDDKHDVYMAGQPVLTGWVYFYELQMLGIFGITGIALLVALIFYMRNVVGVVAPLVTSIIAAIWGFGFVGWLGLPVEPLIMVVPLLLVARSFSHCVQFVERYYEILHYVKDRRRAAEISLSVMMTPGMLGIATDAMGLFIIAVAPIPAMERFALFCGFWAFILIPTNVFLSPLLMLLLPKPRNVERMVGGNEKDGRYSGIKLLLSLIGRLSIGRTSTFTAAALIALAVFSVVKVMELKVGNPVEGSNLLWDDSEFNVAVSNINRHFPGLNTLEIIFESKSQDSMERVVRKAETALTMQRLQHLLESQPNPPEASLSFTDYLPEANRLFSGGNPKWAPLDHDDAAVSAAAGALMVGTGPKAFLHVADFEQRNGTVSLWYKDNKQETVDEALRQARAALEIVGTEHEDFRIRLGSGTIALQQSINDTVDHYQWIILGLLNAVILITCSYAYRSIVAGILLLIPVNLSNLLLGAVMTEMGIGLDVNTLPIAAIGVGVGIDYGIYLLSRIYEEYQQRKDMGPAILASVTTTGKAIFFTATIVLIGILPWYFLSALKFLADMGLLLVMVMLINMIIALIVVPLLVWLIRPRFIESKELMVSEGIDLEALAAEHSDESLRTKAAEMVKHPANELVEVVPLRS